MPSIELNMGATNIAEKLAEIVKTYPDLFVSRNVRAAVKPCPIRIYSHINHPSFADKVRAKRCSGIGVIRGDVLLIDGEHYTVCHYSENRHHFVCTNGASTRFVPFLDVYRNKVPRYRSGIRVKECTVALRHRDLATGVRLSAAQLVTKAIRPAYMRPRSD